ncbi:MAG: hypothetical protein Q8O13_05535 [Candidatus Omnitrophota bacterium]|nr:hypothetical protein [Candidatus Omnitrophota bacterium]
MHLFKVTRSLIHDLAPYTPGTIHEFIYSKDIQQLMEEGVLVPLDEQTKEELQKKRLEMGFDKNCTEWQPTDGIVKTLCPKCEKRVEVLKEETSFYKPADGEFIMKLEICATCRSTLRSKANRDECNQLQEAIKKTPTLSLLRPGRFARVRPDGTLQIKLIKDMT